MKKVYLFGTLWAFACTSTVLSAQEKYEWKEASADGYTYRYLTNDPMKTRFYTLKNGLTLILSQNRQEPRIAVNIPVRTGSNNDPGDHTGLAHYLEHLMFKGTDKFGSLDWAKEKPLLDTITRLYDEYNKIPVADTFARKAKYHIIDSVSGVASHYSIANEYDKLMSSIGSQGTNAYTWVEQTVYVENIPSNALDKFLQIQAERFRNPQFRLFHTELEAVYEEKNRGLDNDNEKVWETLNAQLFPTSNYGQQTTIGTIEHLKNPSLIAIRNYYNKYYVPNNMAIVMAGDFDYNEVVKLADKYFTYKQPQPVADYAAPAEPPVNGPVEKTVVGPNEESVTIGFRIGKAGTHEAMLADLLSDILSNGTAGLIDLNLNKAQKLVDGSAGVEQFKDYGEFIFSGKSLPDQSLEQVKDLLLAQLDSVKEGHFDPAMIKAVVANEKLSKLRGLESNRNRVSAMTNSFIFSRGNDWKYTIGELDEMEKVTAQELMAFVNKYFTEQNYVVVYKKKGEDKNVVKVEKPAISPVETNAGKQSGFVKQMDAEKLPEIKPVWIDYAKDLTKGNVGNAQVLYVPNKENDLYNLYYYYDMGAFNDKYLPYAVQYLQYLGTSGKSAEQFSKDFYQLASSFDIHTGNENVYISVSGLNQNFEKAAALLEDLLHHCQPDAAALEKLKQQIRKEREDAKLNKRTIAQGLSNYALYGPRNPFNYDLSNTEIENMKAEDLVNILHQLADYEHKVLYYGPQAMPQLIATLTLRHQLPARWKPTPAPVKFERQVQKDNEVFFCNYDMVQSEIVWNRNLMQFDSSQIGITNLFNEYFGGGMGTVVFQTIRESKALAYSTYALVRTPSKKEDPFTFTGYVGSQADKFEDAIGAMNELIDSLPLNEQNYNNALSSYKKDIETQRILKQNIIFNYLQLQKWGLSTDYRKSVYQALNRFTLNDIRNYHDNILAHKPYYYTIVASKNKVSEPMLQKLGGVHYLTLEQIFGY